MGVFQLSARDSLDYRGPGLTTTRLRLFGWAVVLAAAVAAVAPLPPVFVERWYSRGLYAIIQPPITAASAVVPFALLDVAAAALVVSAIVASVRISRRVGSGRRTGRAAAAAVVALAAVYLWFLLLWGFNYRRLPLEQKLAYDPARITPELALTLSTRAVEQVNGLVRPAGEPQAAPGPSEDAELAAAFAAVLQELGARHPVRIAQPKRSLVTYYLRQAAIDGMINPFFLEIIVTPDLLPFERPHTLSHEWAHLAGYADESEANFVAWLTCIRSTRLARYSGWLSAYLHLVRVLPGDERRNLQRALDPAVQADLDRIAARLSRASPRISSAARGAYDTYLRANRVDEGIASYGAVVRLMLGTSYEPDWTPRLRH